MKVKAFRESLLGEKGMQIILGSFTLFVTLPIDSASDTDLNILNNNHRQRGSYDDRMLRYARCSTCFSWEIEKRSFLGQWLARVSGKCRGTKWNRASKCAARPFKSTDD